MLFFLFVFQFSFAIENDSIIRFNLVLKQSKTTLLDEEDCDACGCSASGGSMGFSSMLNSNFIGLRYFNQSYKSSNGLYSNSPWYNESFNTIQVWAKIPLVERVQLSILLPYHFHNRSSVIGLQNISGLGDVTLLGMYQLYQTHRDSTLLMHTLQLGAGVKAPIGKFDSSNGGSINPSFQVGTGSWDYLLVTEYVVKRKQFGMNTMLNYVFKTENEKNYRFGNQFNYATTFFYTIEKSKLTFLPQLGIAGEVYQENYQHKQKVRNTSGDILFGKLGMEIGKNKLSMGVNAMLPISQNLTGGNVKANYRLSFNLNYTL